jgi:hypothetical protein
VYEPNVSQNTAVWVAHVRRSLPTA